MMKLFWQQHDSSLFSICRDDSAEVDVYNPLKNEWDKISPMTQVCITHQMLVSWCSLFVIL